MKLLSDYLEEVSLRKWQPGVLDCGIFIADWLVLLMGSDPISDLRGSYRSDVGFARIVRREGGFIKSCSVRMAKIGLSVAGDAKPGDVAAVLAPYLRSGGRVAHRPTGAIVVTPRLRAVVTPDKGLVVANEDRLPIMKAWTNA